MRWIKTIQKNKVVSKDANLHVRKSGHLSEAVQVSDLRFWIDILVLPLLSSFLLILSSLPSKFFILNFFAFVPLLFAAKRISIYRKFWLLFFIQNTIVLLTFYLFVGMWILQTANLGFLISLILILPMLILLQPYILLLRKNEFQASIYFVAAWLVGEYFQVFFELGSPFYALGNNLGVAPWLVQWYAWTGSAGGSLWILVTNFLFYSLLKSLFVRDEKLNKKLYALILVLLIPTLGSLMLYFGYNENGKPAEVLIVHPSTENSDVKYRLNIYDLMDIYMDLAMPHLTSEIEYMVLPETAITNTGWVTDYPRNLVFERWYEQTVHFPNLKLISGAIAYEAIQNVEAIEDYKSIPGIRFSEKYQTWYYTYNAAIQLEKVQPVQFRVKEGLVPYQEYAPYPQVLPKLAPVGIDFQFSKRAKNRVSFVSSNNHKTAALICYEVVYGNQFAKAAQDGAEAFFMLLNEGWYQNPKVPKQFLQLSVIRAIENRRSIAHCSNLGISAFINQRGDIVAQTNTAEGTILKHTMRFNKKRTFYSFVGNYIGILALAVSVFLLLKLMFTNRMEENR